MVIAPQDSRPFGIKRRIGDDQLLVFVAPSVVPDDGTAVAIEAAACGIAPASRTQEVDTRTTQEEVSMVVHAVALASP